MIEDPTYWFNNVYVLDYFGKAAAETLKLTAGIAVAVGGVVFTVYALLKGANTIGENLDSDGVRHFEWKDRGLVGKIKGKN